MKAIINAGHYVGLDSGAVGSITTESEITYELMKLVSSYLKKAGVETVEVTKNELYEITEIANEANADLFVSIHCNACNHNARGTESFHYYGSKEGKLLSTYIQNQLICSIDTIDRGVKEAGFYVLKYTDCPAALIEVAFIDNVKDEQLLIDCKDEIARAIARGVTDYLVKISK